MTDKELYDKIKPQMEGCDGGIVCESLMYYEKTGGFRLMQRGVLLYYLKVPQVFSMGGQDDGEK